VVVVGDDGSASEEEEAPSRPLPMDRLGWAACGVAAAGFAVVLVGWAAGGGAFSVPWAPTLDLRLSFALDGLGALYALLATGVGALVFAYGTRYLTVHLEHEHRQAWERWRFWPGCCCSRWRWWGRPSTAARDAGGRRSPRGAVDRRAVPRQLPQDVAQPDLGDGVQPGRGPPSPPGCWPLPVSCCPRPRSPC